MTTPTTYLKFPSQAIFEELMAQAGLTHVREDGTVSLSLSSHERTIDVIGTIYNPPGEYSTDPATGEPIKLSPPVALVGYHVNISGNVPDELKEYIIDAPTTPHRVFF
jgi:hypothetical protein